MTRAYLVSTPVAFATALTFTGCDGHRGTSGDDTTSTSSTTTTASEPWFEVGWGETTYEPLMDGDTLRVVWGAQGSAMFPLPLRGGGFTLPDDPSDYTDPKAPLLDLELDIDGFNDGVGGHFRRIANYPIVFHIEDDGSYAFNYIPLVLPDHVDPALLEGRDAHLWMQLRPFEAEPLVVELDLVVTVDDAPPL